MQVPILLILRDPALRVGLARRLREEGLAVSEAETTAAGIRVARQTSPALVLLEHGRSDGTGAALFAYLRPAGEPFILLLGAGASDTEVAAALEAGADDYLRMPCSSNELLAHVRALLRRRGGRASPRPRELRIGDLYLSVPLRQVFLGGRTVHLAPKEFEILRLLAEQAGRVVTRVDLIREVWPGAQTVKSSTLDVHVFSLRTKLEEDPARPKWILTVRAVGYRLVGAEEV
jgi:DNA-binding response OmpR family regulator